MKKAINLLLIFQAASLIFFSCKNSKSNNETSKVLNNGRVVVSNGKGEKDSVDFHCIGCEENIKTKELFDNIINEATTVTKNTLLYPLSFIPKKIDLTVAKEDSLIYFDNNKKIENVIQVFSKYKYIGKNGYGNELEGESINSIYIKDGKVEDLKNEIKLKTLSFEDKYINRTLAGYTNSSEFIEFTPLKDKSIIVQSSLSCVDEGSSFQITLLNNEEIRLESWNDFNCDGTSYFRWFSKSQIENLKSSRIKYLFIYSRGKSVMVAIPKNKSDYFQQLFDLYK